MEEVMRDLALQAAGILAILTAMIHGAIGELKVFTRAQIEPRGTRRLLRLIFQASTIDWIGIGILLIATPALGSERARHWIVALAVLVYGYAAFGNALATRGRHVGWLLMVGVMALALAGL
jgi:hypothetical protein